MSNFNWEKYQFIDHLNVKKHEVNNLPKGVIISTMCASCKDGLGTNINIDVNDFSSIKQLVLKEEIDMVIVGPEDPLVNGISNFFKVNEALKDIIIIGPCKEGK